LIESAGVIVTSLARAPEFIEHLVDKWLASLGRQRRRSIIVAQLMRSKATGEREFAALRNAQT
jgi:hypothetical protein